MQHGQNKRDQPASLLTPESAIRWCISSGRQKPRFAISSASAAEDAILTLSRFLRSISPLTGLHRKAKATMGNKPYYPEDGDSTWCAFHRDDNSNEVLLRADNLLKRRAIIWPTQSIFRVVVPKVLIESASGGRSIVRALIRLLKPAKQNPRL